MIYPRTQDIHTKAKDGELDGLWTYWRKGEKQKCLERTYVDGRCINITHYNEDGSILSVREW